MSWETFVGFHRFFMEYSNCPVQLFWSQILDFKGEPSVPNYFEKLIAVYFLSCSTFFLTDISWSGFTKEAAAIFTSEKKNE